MEWMQDLPFVLCAEAGLFIGLAGSVRLVRYLQKRRVEAEESTLETVEAERLARALYAARDLRTQAEGASSFHVDRVVVEEEHPVGVAAQ